MQGGVRGLQGRLRTRCEAQRVWDGVEKGRIACKRASSLVVSELEGAQGHGRLPYYRTWGYAYLLSCSVCLDSLAHTTDKP